MSYRINLKLYWGEAKAKKLTQTAIAGKLGITREYLSTLMSGKNPWVEEKRGMLADVLGVPVSDLFEAVVSAEVAGE